MSRVIVKYDEWSRMGNRMFSYAIGRIIAERKKYQFIAEAITSFSKTYNHTPSSDISSLHNPLSLRSIFGSHSIDFNIIDEHNGDIVIDSFAQQADHYIDHRDKIREWFEIENDIQVDPDELVVHIRETDYKSINMFLGDTFYVDIIDNLSYNKVTIVTDNCRSPLIVKLANAGCRIHSTEPVTKFSIDNNATIMDDFKYMQKANSILLSQSSFSWWAAFLGNPSRVLFPISVDRGMWKSEPGSGDINLYVPGWEKIIN